MTEGPRIDRKRKREKKEKERKKKRKEKRTFQTSTPCIPIVEAREVSDSLQKKKKVLNIYMYTVWVMLTPVVGPV